MTFGRLFIVLFIVFIFDVTLLIKNFPCAVVDMFEPVRSEMNAAVPTSDHYHHIVHIDDLRKEKYNSVRFQGGSTSVCYRLQTTNDFPIHLSYKIGHLEVWLVGRLCFTSHRQ